MASTFKAPGLCLIFDIPRDRSPGMRVSQWRYNRGANKVYDVAGITARYHPSQIVLPFIEYFG
jgi:hypothetical protein